MIPYFGVAIYSLWIGVTASKTCLPSAPFLLLFMVSHGVQHLGLCVSKIRSSFLPPDDSPRPRKTHEEVVLFEVKGPRNPKKDHEDLLYLVIPSPTNSHVMVCSLVSFFTEVVSMFFRTMPST